MLRARYGRSGRRVALAAALGLLMVAASSCGGSNSTGSPAAGSSSVAAKLSGSPVKVMTVASVNWNGPAFPDILTSAKLYEQWINARGGIDGHALQVITCDDQGDANQTAACGRKAVAENVVAVVGSFTLNSDKIVPILQTRNIPWFGICCSLSDADRHDAVSFPFGGQGATPGLAVKAYRDGCRHIGLLSLDLGAAAKFNEDLLRKGVKSIGAAQAYAKTVLVPVSAQDYSPQAAQVKDGTDCIVGFLADNNWASFLTAFQQAGGKQRLYGYQGNLNGKIAERFPEQTQNAVVGGGYSDLSLPAWDDFRAAIDKFDAPKDLDYNSSAALGTWAAYSGFTQVAKSITGELTNASFLSAASRAKIDLKGMAPPVDFSKPVEGMARLGLGRVFTNAVTFDVIKDGRRQPFRNGAFYDMSNALRDQPLGNAGPLGGA
jgi:ABC-type branched-subunit amino acid transport system substrate-binding protein